MKKILLSQNKVTFVDEADYDRVIQFNWYYGSLGYAVTTIKGKKIYLHSFILDTPKGKETDHINLDKLDNRRVNLRVCTKAENRRNKNKDCRNTSGYRGVTWYKPYEKWRAYTRMDNKFIHIGYFKDKKEAALAYNEAITKLHKEFARVNIL